MIFIYTGRDLGEPLLRLLRHLENERNRILHLELHRFARLNDDEILLWAADAERIDRNVLAREYVALVAASRETALWLFEARRQPKARWRLTMEQLARLRPIEVAPETRADLQLSTPAPWQRWRRLVARLRRWTARPARSSPVASLIP